MNLALWLEMNNGLFVKYLVNTILKSTHVIMAPFAGNSATEKGCSAQLKAPSTFVLQNQQRRLPCVIEFVFENFREADTKRRDSN